MIEVLRDALRRAIEKEGRQIDVAAKAGVSQAHVSDVMRGKAEPHDPLVAWLGFERETVYRRTRKANAA